MHRLVKISELFDLKYGNSLELINLEQCKSTEFNSIPFVSRTEKNNGISTFVYEMLDIDPNPAHTLTVALGGSVLSTFYQPIPFYTGFHVLVLTPKKYMTVIEMLFYAKCILSNKYKYNYGRQANKTLKEILIPKEIPKETLNHLNNYKKNLRKKFIDNPFVSNKLDLNTENWKYFNINDIFDISLGKPIHSNQLEESNSYELPYITRTGLNNGLAYFAEPNFLTDEKINKKNAITIGAEGYKAFFQSNDFINGNKISILRNKKLNKYNALFLCLILNIELCDKFNYGRGATNNRIKKLKIKLPFKNDRPDFEFMENYIKTIKYSRAL